MIFDQGTLAEAEQRLVSLFISANNSAYPVSSSNQVVSSLMYETAIRLRSVTKLQLFSLSFAQHC